MQNDSKNICFSYHDRIWTTWKLMMVRKDRYKGKHQLLHTDLLLTINPLFLPGCEHIIRGKKGIIL